ncbi:MAG: methionyl-tRNA formyltransferase [Oscillospiraceae bacterium]|nr:methionyl-tRNA formyltransferase [Oscillospiraceae bacterium]
MKPKIMFMGTPDFADVILKRLHAEGYDICAVVTNPDKPKGRGYEMQPPPVKVTAEKLGLPVYQPVTLKNAEFLEEVKPDMIVLAAYGKILPKNFIEYNNVCVHPSLLPKYRGAAPIQRAIMNGETVTGITIMQMGEGIDTGDILLQTECAIEDSDNFESLHDRLAILSADLLIEALKQNPQPVKQDDAHATYAPKIDNSELLIDFGKSATEINNHIRALSPFAVLNGRKIKILSAKVSNVTEGSPGIVVSLSNGVISVVCGEGTLNIETLLPEGKGKMKAGDFINGRKISIGDVFNDGNN